MTVTEQLNALENILKQGDIQSLYQPIISLSNRSIYGYEALTRGPSNSSLHGPLSLFSLARQAGRLSHLELLSRHSACQGFAKQALPGKLFLNVSPQSLLEAHHQPGRTLQLLQDLSISPDQVVIELSEQAPIEDFNVLDSALRHYRAMGFSIALDDLGTGYSGLRLWSELRPDYVKIDRHFIDDIHQDAVKREFVGSILRMAKASRAQIIAEGVERNEELGTLIEMGLDLVQGYLLCRPQAYPPRDPCTLIPAPQNVIADAHTNDLSSLLSEQPAVPQSATILRVLEVFRQRPNLLSLAVINEQHHPIGIVHRHLLSDALLKPFAADLFARKPISRLMSHDFLAVDIGHSLQQVSRLLTSRARQRMEEDFIITQQGGYLGLGRVIDVLKLITEMKIHHAQHANPLTRLPGNVPIQQCLKHLLQQGREALICYIDIDNFKPFNDQYGFAKGDEILLCLAQCLSDHIDSRCDFIGHIGGDDFMLVLSPEHWRQQLQLMQESFQSQCKRHYRAEDLNAGYFSAANRKGLCEQFALLSLSIGVVHLRHEHRLNLDATQLASLASEAKLQAKKIPGYSLHLLEPISRCA